MAHLQQRKRPMQSAFAVYNSSTSKLKKNDSSSLISKTNGKDNQLKKKFSRLELLAQLKGSKTSVSSIRKVRFEDDVHSQNAASLKKSLKQKQEMSHFCEEEVPGILTNGKFMCLEKTEEKTLKPQNEDMQYTLKDRKAVITHPKNEVNGNQETSLHVNKDHLSSNKIKSPRMPPLKDDSEKDGQALFEWLIQPFSTKKFFSENWEKKPLLLKRHKPNYADGIFSTEDFNRILKDCNIRYDVNLDITTYQNGTRETHNIEGRAFPSVVWDYYNNGCSIRLKNPQSFSNSVWKLCSTLQEYFKSMVGANVYLTPPGTQGFAPHYDDIEAFVLQLEGKKHWSLYNPKSPEETLPRYSSRNFNAVEIGEEIFTTTLSPGDLLYFPRGFIHQARSLPDEHSLHITISTYQKNSWGDFLEELVPKALSKAINEDVTFRKGLPLDYLSYLGLQNSDKTHQRRKDILSQVSSMVRRLADHIEADETADILGASFLHDALPPVLSKDELSRSVRGADVKLTSPGRPSACLSDIGVKTKIRIVRKNALRVCVNGNTEEDQTDTIRVFHSVQNSRVYHKEEMKFFDVEQEFGPAIEYLIHNYPNYVAIKNLPLDDEDEKIQFATSLYEKGLLLTEKAIGLIESPDE